MAMPATKRLLKDRGVTFSNHFVTTPICCPSRVNLLRGQLSHNTNFTDVLGPHGGYAKFLDLGLDRDWLPGWLQRSGYSTMYTGKFLVDYTIRNCNPPPAGWTLFDALVHPFTFEYYCPAFSLNGAPAKMYPAQYVTDVLASKAVALLRSAAADPSGRPFYLQVAPPAPHHSMHYDYNASGVLTSRHWYPPVPAARHWEELSGAQLPRPPSFNDWDVAGKPAWVRGLDRLTPANITFLEEVYRLRLRCMRAVDELIETLVTELESLGLADNTFVAFTSDNGYHEGPHRMGSGKTTAYDEDIRVPMMMAGPGLLPGSRVAATTQHIDIAPTVLALAGLPLPPSLDGTPLPLAGVSDGSLPASYPYGRPDQGPFRNQLLAEFWGEWLEESIHSHPPYSNLTWKAVRVLRSDSSEAYKYVLHCSGEFELYDLVRDPYERTNLLAPGGAVRGALAGWWGAVMGAVMVFPHAAEVEEGPAADDEPSDDGGVGNGGGGGGKGDDSRSDSSSSSDSNGSSGSSDSGSGDAASGAAAAPRSAAGTLAAWAKTAWAVAATAARGSARALGISSPASPGTAAYAQWLARMRGRLDALLAVLAVCSGQACTQPFQVLHPDGSVSDLWAAMEERYDDMYDQIQPFSFGQCLPYQDVDNERSAFRGAVVPGCEAARGDPGSAEGGDPMNPATGQAGGRTSAGLGHPADADASNDLAADEEGAVDGGVSEQLESGAGGDGGRQLQRRQRRLRESTEGGALRLVEGGALRLVEADVESSAVPLPRKYLMITDVYGGSGAQDAMLLA